MLKMHPNKYINFLLHLVYLVLIGTAIFFCYKYLLKLLLPLLFAYLLSGMIIRPVNFISRRLGLPRGIISAVMTLLIVTVVGSLLAWGISALIVQGAEFINSLPDMLDSLGDKLDSAQITLQEVLRRLPGGGQNSTSLFDLEAWMNDIKLPQIDIAGLLTSVGSVASSVPNLLITTVFLFVATFFLTSRREEINAFVRRQTGDKFFRAAGEMKDFFYVSALKWVKAQGILICFTFCVLCVGFLIIGQPYAVVVAFLIAFIDALPILGIGAVMIPWAIIDLFSGSFKHAAALCILYGAVLIVRNAIEPKIVGDQLGLHPFVTLLSVYFGWQLAGFLGIFLIPVVVLALIRLQDSGYIRLWKPVEKKKDGSPKSPNTDK